MLPPDLQAYALNGIGYHQAEVGDAEGALATLERLQAALPGKVQDYDMHRSLAPLLAATGHREDAVEMAVEMKNATVTALIASLIN